MKVYAYYRVSTDMQIDSGAGLASQEDICNAWCLRNNTHITRSFVEKAISGAAPLDKRPALFQAITCLEKGDVLLVSRLDRLSRDIYGGIVIDEAVAHQEGRVISAAGEGTDSDDPASKMIRDIIRVVAGFERSITQFRIKAALAAKKARGERVGPIPFGYQLGKDRKLYPSPEEQVYVEQMIEYRKQGLSMTQVAEKMNEKGVLSRLGKPWSKNSLFTTLKYTEHGTQHLTRRKWS
jgi:DNA invertase Pin-like site-specific DNA recombinase